MTALVAVVRTPADAAAAIAEGADRLAIRAAPWPLLSAVGEVVRGRPVSLWWDEGAEPAVPDMASALAACGADEVWAAPGLAPVGVRWWVVLPPGDPSGITLAAGRGCDGAVIDPGRNAPGLFRLVSAADLERQCRALTERGLPFGFAGAMEAPDVPRLLAFAPDRLVLDDFLQLAAPEARRVVPERVRLARDLMRTAPTARSAATPVDPGHTVIEQIFVRDWTVSLHLGAYTHEVAPQRVRFTVTVDLGPRAGTRTADMRDVVSYDLITDAIARATVVHVDLVETIADSVATNLLAHPRIQAVDITVEKLDLGPGTLGCRLRRLRAAS